MKVKAYWKSINPFIPDINQLRYTKTVEVDNDVDMKELEKFAIEDSKKGYRFDRFEILDEEQPLKIILNNGEKMIFTEGFRYEMKEGFNDGTVKTQEDYDNAKWITHIYKHEDRPTIERMMFGKNAHNGLLGLRNINPEMCPNCGMTPPITGRLNDEYMTCDACGTDWKSKRP